MYLIFDIIISRYIDALNEILQIFIIEMLFFQIGNTKFDDIKELRTSVITSVVYYAEEFVFCLIKKSVFCMTSNKLEKEVTD